MSSRKIRATQPAALSRGFYWNLNFAFSERTYYAGCLKKFAIIRRTQKPFSGYIYLMCRVLAHIFFIYFLFLMV